MIELTVSPHQLRHSCALTMLQATKDIAIAYREDCGSREFRYTGQLCRGGHAGINLSKRVNVAKSIGLAKKLMSRGCQSSKPTAGVTSSIAVSRQFILAPL